MTSSTNRQMNEALRQRLLQDKLVQDMIERRAYEIFLRRNGEHGHDREDWLQAENEILDELTETDLRRMPDLAAADSPARQVHSAKPDYQPAAPKATAPTPPASRQPSEPSVPAAAKTAPSSSPYTNPSRKKPEKAKSTPKRKKAASPDGGTAGEPAGAVSKSKKSKSGDQPKAGKKKDKKP
jgi:hypothetical protein